MTTISLNTNLPSLRAQNNLTKSTRRLTSVMESLSSGLRINRASDDAAGLAIADSLRADAKLASVAIRNANDGISLISIADEALATIGDILQRMAELANQSANGVYTNDQRSALNQEFLALRSETDRVASATTFNGVALLAGSSNIALQVGIDNSGNSTITLTSVLGTTSSLSISSNTVSTSAAALTALTAVNNAIGSIATRRGTLGAAQSRLEYAVNYLSAARENFLAAESRIRDVNVAEAVADFTRLQILQQAGAAVLAQANSGPELALRLLQ
jgi:flagellin